jgi:adenylate kinase family enzyme
MLPPRVLIYGVTGSGKSTLARRLAERSHRAWTSVDDLTWLPNWVQVPDDEQRRIFRDICQGEEWILDTAYGKWLDEPVSRADLIIALDYPRYVSLGRLLWRTLRRVVTKETSCGGNQESLRQTLSGESIIAWHFRSFASKRVRIKKMEQEKGPDRVLRMTHPSQTEAFLERVRPAP